MVVYNTFMSVKSNPENEQLDSMVLNFLVLYFIFMFRNSKNWVLQNCRTRNLRMIKTEMSNHSGFCNDLD